MGGRRRFARGVLPVLPTKDVVRLNQNHGARVVVGGRRGCACAFLPDLPTKEVVRLTQFRDARARGIKNMRENASGVAHACGIAHAFGNTGCESQPCCLNHTADVRLPACGQSHASCEGNPCCQNNTRNFAHAIQHTQKHVNVAQWPKFSEPPSSKVF